MTQIKYKPLLPNRVAFLVVHCSATRPSMDWDVSDVRKEHLKQGWIDVGYHYVITRDGRIQEGRPLDRQGAHVRGYNHLSVGVCLIGGVSEDDVNVPENNFTYPQFVSLANLLVELREKFPNAEVLGHRDMPNVRKACPSFDVRSWLAERDCHL